MISDKEAEHMHAVLATLVRVSITKMRESLVETCRMFLRWHDAAEATRIATEAERRAAVSARVDAAINRIDEKIAESLRKDARNHTVHVPPPLSTPYREAHELPYREAPDLPPLPQAVRDHIRDIQARNAAASEFELLGYVRPFGIPALMVAHADDCDAVASLIEEARLDAQSTTDIVAAQAMTIRRYLVTCVGESPVAVFEQDRRRTKRSRRRMFVIHTPRVLR